MHYYKQEPSRLLPGHFPKKNLMRLLLQQRKLSKTKDKNIPSNDMQKNKNKDWMVTSGLDRTADRIAQSTNTCFDGFKTKCRLTNKNTMKVMQKAIRKKHADFDFTRKAVKKHTRLKKRIAWEKGRDRFSKRTFDSLA